LQAGSALDRGKSGARGELSTRGTSLASPHVIACTFTGLLREMAGIAAL
jgi:hypothetical protein